MPILDQYTRENEAPPEPIGYERDDHDPNDDSHEDENEIPADFYEALDQANQILNNEDEQ